MSFPRNLQPIAPYLLAFVLALLSNYFFTGEWLTRFKDQSPHVWGVRQIAATLLLLGAIGIATFSFSKKDDFVFQPPDLADPPDSHKKFWGPLIPALGLYLVVQFCFLWLGENNFIRWMWLASIVGLIVPFLRSFDWRAFWPLPFWEYILIVLIVLGGFIVRYVDLTKIPYHIDNDVSIMGLYSQTMLLNDDQRWVGMAPTNHQLSEHQFLVTSMRLFGVNHTGLVMLSVLAGSATVGLLYFFGKISFNRWVGFIAASFLAFNYVHIHFSRIVFGPITTFFVVLGGLLLVNGMRRVNPASFLFAGISFGIGLLGYYSARVGPVVVVCVFIYWWLTRKAECRIQVRHWLLCLVGMFVAFGPNVAFSLAEAQQFHGRGSEVIIWTDGAWKHLSHKYNSMGNTAVVLFEQTKRTLLAPFYFPDESIICHLRKPMLGATAALSFILGLGFLLRRLRDLPGIYLLFWIALTFLCGGILTIDPPFWPHLNIAIPGMAMVAAVGAERFFRRLILSFPKPAAVIFPALLAVAILFSALHEWEVYYRFSRDYAGGRVLAMREVEKLTPEYKVYFVSSDIKWKHETFQFFNPQIDGSNISGKELFEKTPEINKPTAFFIFADADQQLVDHLARRFPYSSRRVFLDAWRWPVFTMIRVFPLGYMEYPQSARKPADILWNQQGWRYVAMLLIGAIVIGWLILRRDLKLSRVKNPCQQQD